jgi:aryl-alcohol dehydrogenase-like predicted oxidoreductase
MKYQRVGQSGLTVSRLVLGSQFFGGSTEEDEAHDLMAAALDVGINFFDTSNMYQEGASEIVMGDGLKKLGVRDQVVLATKVYYRMGPGLNDFGAGRLHILQELENSLRRLKTDHLDLYYLHRPDFETPLDETIEVMDQCVRDGKVRHWGTSTFPSWRMAEAHWRAERRGWIGPIGEQAPYNILDRRVETERLPFLRAHGWGLMTWSSIAGGLLSGKYDVDAMDNPPPGSRLAVYNERWKTRVGPRTLHVAKDIANLAAESGVTPVQFATAWQLHQDPVTAAVIGPRDRQQLDEYVAAVDVEMGQDLLAEVDRLAPPGTAVADFHDTADWYVGAINS